jgi:predicted anti-sigma-YlaC factor YlaD
MTDCAQARDAVSAARDGEGALDSGVHTHLQVCGSCQIWAQQVDRLTARLRVDAVDTPDVLPQALAAWDAQEGQHDVLRPYRVLLTVAGVASLGLAVAHLADVQAVTAADVHTSRELAAVESALGCGFLLAAWRPDRFILGLAPIVALLATLLAVVAAVDVIGGNTTVLGELVHLPALSGAVVLLFARRLIVRREPAGAPARDRALAGTLARS